MACFEAGLLNNIYKVPTALITNYRDEFIKQCGNK